MVRKCLDFSTNIIEQRNQYDRMSPDYAMHNTDLKLKIRIMRTFVGKLGELCFSSFLTQQNIEHDISEMFEIFEGQTNVDSLDFATKSGEDIDVKTAVFKNHKRLVVPLDQIMNIPKSFYVGIKLDIDVNGNRYENIDPYKIKTAQIWGFCTLDTLRKLPTKNLGEFPCKAISSQNLQPIKYLLDLM